MSYDIESIRRKLRDSMGGKKNDPDEFKPEKVKDAPIEWRFFILPPLQKGDTVKGGTASKGMENFFIPSAAHWIENKPYPCPRVWDGSGCPICQFGFDLLKEEKNEEKRKGIISQFMPATYYLVNIFFPNVRSNPESLRGVVKYYKAPKTCIDRLGEALLRNDSGAEDDPQAHGVFFDENAAFLFLLKAEKLGKNNSYKASKFIVSKDFINGVPIAQKSPGVPDAAAIKAILDSRIDLWTKVEEPDHEKINKVYQTIVNGDDSSTDAGFDADEHASEPVIENTAPPPPSAPKAEKKASGALQKPAKTSFPASKPTDESSLAGELEPVATKTSPKADADGDELAGIEQLLEQME